MRDSSSDIQPEDQQTQWQLPRIADESRSKSMGDYVPDKVSFGPAYSGQDRLRMYEMFKGEFIKRRLPYRSTRLGELVQFLIGNPYHPINRIRQWYRQFDCPSNDETLSWMLVRDGFFLMHILREMSRIPDSDHWSVFHGMSQTPDCDVARYFRPSLLSIPVYRDIIKLENQIPLFVLENILLWEAFTYRQMMVDWKAVMGQEPRFEGSLEGPNLPRAPYQQMMPGPGFEGPQLQGPNVPQGPGFPEMIYSQPPTQTQTPGFQTPNQTQGSRFEGEMYSQIPIENQDPGEMYSQTPIEKHEPEGTKIHEDMNFQLAACTDHDLNSIMRRAWRILCPFPYMTGSEQASHGFAGVALRPESHFLGFVYESIIGSSRPGPTVDLETKKTKNRERRVVNLPAAAELHRKRVKFASHKGHLNEIHFDRRTRTIHLPTIKMANITDTVMRNLLAYEALACKDKRKPINCYVELMSQFIKKEEDIDVLTESDIIRSPWGIEEAVVRFWSEIGKEVEKGDYEPIDAAIDDIIVYTTKYRIMYSEFKETYFSKPWITLSLIAGCLLFVFTVLQTLLSWEQVRLQKAQSP